MRAITHVLAAVLLASVGIAAILLLVTGRSFVYSPGLGSTGWMGDVISTWGLIAIAGAGSALILRVLANAMPKVYFQLMLWRDLAWMTSLIAASAVVCADIAEMALYGVF